MRSFNKLAAGGKNVMVDCRCCGKATHSNIDGEGTGMCRPCINESNLENVHADGYHDSDNPNAYQADGQYGSDECPECHPEIASDCPAA